jgi:hypothetical protein
MMGPILSSIHRVYVDLSAVISELSHTKRSFDSLLARLSVVAPPIPNPSKSYWQEDPPFPNLVGVQSPDLPRTADIVIIGSGISGASVAYTILNQSQKRGIYPGIVVLEARNLCSGATGRNGGHIKCSPYMEYARLKARFGVEHAKKLLNFQRRHLAIILDLVQQNEDLKISEVREVQTVDSFTDEHMWNEAKKMVQELREDAPDIAEDIVLHDGTEACEVSFISFPLFDPLLNNIGIPNRPPVLLRHHNLRGWSTFTISLRYWSLCISSLDIQCCLFHRDQHSCN